MNFLRIGHLQSAICNLLIAVVLIGCASPQAAGEPAAQPTTGTLPAEDFALVEPQALDWALVPLDVRVYLDEVEPYTSLAAIVLAPEMHPQALDGIVAILEQTPVPDVMEPAHWTLLKGYRQLAEGRHMVVDNIRDNLLRAEGYSLMDFGQVLLREHVQIVSAYLAAQQATPAP